PGDDQPGRQPRAHESHMQPFNVLVKKVSDPDLGLLLTKIREAGYADPHVTQTGSRPGAEAATADAPPSDGGDLPAEWTLVREMDGQSYTWPEQEEHYGHYAIYAAKTKREGTVHVALGHAGRANVGGKDREYIIAFLTSAAPQTPLSEFLETD